MGGLFCFNFLNDKVNSEQSTPIGYNVVPVGEVAGKRSTHFPLNKLLMRNKIYQSPKCKLFCLLAVISSQNMKIKDLSKAAKILEKLSILDKQINEIEKVAEMIANSETESSFTFSMKVKDVKKEQEESIKATIDSDGLLSFGDSGRGLSGLSRLYGFSMFATDSKSDKKDKSEKLNFDLSENESLGLLGLMIGKKQRERQELLIALSEYGVS